MKTPEGTPLIDPKNVTGDPRNWTKEEYDAVVAAAQRDFPPSKAPKFKPKGLGVDFYNARRAAGLTYYAVAKAAGIPDPRTVKQIEAGNDVKLSSLEAVAKVLGLKLKVVAA